MHPIAQLFVGAALAVAGVILGADVRAPVTAPALMIVAGVVLAMFGVFALMRRPGAANDR